MNEIRELIDKLNYYTKLYDEGKSPITDEEWDDMYFKLVKLEQDTGIYLSNSPTQRVNYEVVNELKKVKHSHPMLSLAKTKSIDELNNFIGNKECLIMAKLDGLTCSLTYDGGRLIAAETRGNGEIGEDILHNALVVKNIPNKIDYKNKLIIDGEIICDYKSFKDFENDYKNPRNFASGSIRLLDSKECEKRKLSFIAWDVIEGFEDNEFLNTRLIELEVLGFTIVPMRPTDTITIEEKIEEIKSKCKDFGYPIDGCVIKYNNVNEYNAAGRTDHHFKGGIAFKFYDDEYETELLGIEYDIGRTGQLTPVAIYKDIDIDGTICNRASLHNQSILKQTLHGIGWIGQKIMIAKMNMIIPQVISAEEDNELTKMYIDYPHVCPICGELTSIHKDNESEVLFCDNPNCEGKISTQIAHFVSKNCLDIKGLSRTTIEKLLDWEFIKDKQSIFELKNFRKEWINKTGFGEKSVDKILQAIEESKNVTLDRVIAAAGIPEIGTRVAKDLAKHYGTWKDFRSEMDYTIIDGIGEVMNENLISFDYEEIDNIVEKYLNIIKNNDIINIENNLEGLVIVITGKLQHGNRKELKNKIESLGGKVTDSVSSKTSMLINNDKDSSSSKNVKAKQLNIPIITEQEFYEKYLQV